MKDSLIFYALFVDHMIHHQSNGLPFLICDMTELEVKGTASFKVWNIRAHLKCCFAVARYICIYVLKMSYLSSFLFCLCFFFLVSSRIDIEKLEDRCVGDMLKEILHVDRNRKDCVNCGGGKSIGTKALNKGHIVYP